MLSDATKAEIRELIAQYPYPRSALGPALHAVQRVLGWVPAEAAEEVANLLGMEATDVHAFLGFYTMYHKKPQGIYHLEICTSISCQLRAAERCAAHLMAILGLSDWGQTTPNGLFTLDHTGCLGACGTAPMMSVRKRGEELPRYYEALTPGRLEEIIADLRMNVARPLPPVANRTGPAHCGGMEPKFLLRRVDRPIRTASEPMCRMEAIKPCARRSLR